MKNSFWRQQKRIEHPVQLIENKDINVSAHPKCPNTKSVFTQTEETGYLKFHSPCFFSSNISDTNKQCQINHTKVTVVDAGVCSSERSLCFTGYEKLIKRNRIKHLTGSDKEVLDFLNALFQ